MTASDNGLSLGIRLLPGETAARLDEYLRDAKGSFVSFLSSVHTAPVEFTLDFDASESRCMEATGLVWSIDPSTASLRYCKRWRVQLRIVPEA